MAGQSTSTVVQMPILVGKMESGTTLERHFLRLKERFADATIRLDPGVRTHSVHIPLIDLPTGWNKDKTAIWFTVPDGYPSASPDCFWSEDLRLPAGGEPKSSQTNNPHPMAPAGSRWFSWHAQSWNPATCDLYSYMSIIRNRLEQLG